MPGENFSPPPPLDRTGEGVGINLPYSFTLMTNGRKNVEVSAMDVPVTRVFLVDDNIRVRTGIKRFLENTPDIIVVGEAGDGAEALAMVESVCPDVMILDMEMPSLNGNQVAQKLQARQSPVRILILSAYDDQQFILGVLENGAAGYLTKDEAPQVLVKAVRGVARGEQGWVSQRVAARIAALSPRQGPDRMTLTFRELEILRLVADRRPEAEIATQLDISEPTVERHLQMLMVKLGVASRLELVVRAKQEGIV